MRTGEGIFTGRKLGDQMADRLRAHHVMRLHGFPFAGNHRCNFFFEIFEIRPEFFFLMFLKKGLRRIYLPETTDIAKLTPETAAELLK